MDIPTHEVSLVVRVDDRAKLAQYIEALRGAGRPLDAGGPLPNLVLAVCESVAAARGYSIVHGHAVHDVGSNICDVKLQMKIPRPEILNAAANIALAKLGVELGEDPYPSTAQQVALEMQAMFRDGVIDPGLAVDCNLAGHEVQQGVRLAWVYPDEDGGSVAAYVDPISGYVSHAGGLPEDAMDSAVRQRVEDEDGEIYDAVTVRTSDGYSFLLLRPAALAEFNANHGIEFDAARDDVGMERASA